MTHSKVFWTVPLITSLWLLRLPCSSAASLAGQSRTLSRHVQSSKPDPFVQVAPLILAAVCSDGVAVIAAHTWDEDEPLLYYSAASSDDVIHDTTRSSADATSNHENENDDTAAAASDELPYLDLPRDFAGPFRIQLIDDHGCTMLATGWRADCDELVARARAVAAAEQRRHGGVVAQMRSHFLARAVSIYMAQCAASNQVRALSSVGFLVSPAATTTAAPPESSPSFKQLDSSLWLIDVTGAYPVRAMCVGGGLDASSNEPVAKLVQRRLLESDFTKLTAEEGLQYLLRLLSSRDQEQPVPPLLKHGTRLEMAIVDNARRQLIRKHIHALSK